MNLNKFTEKAQEAVLTAGGDHSKRTSRDQRPPVPSAPSPDLYPFSVKL